jgi:hypothetical protein
VGRGRGANAAVVQNAAEAVSALMALTVNAAREGVAGPASRSLVCHLTMVTCGRRAH